MTIMAEVKIKLDEKWVELIENQGVSHDDIKEAIRKEMAEHLGEKPIPVGDTMSLRDIFAVIGELKDIKLETINDHKKKILKGGGN